MKFLVLNHNFIRFVALLESLKWDSTLHSCGHARRKCDPNKFARTRCRLSIDHALTTHLYSPLHEKEAPKVWSSSEGVDTVENGDLVPQDRGSSIGDSFEEIACSVQRGKAD
jgi:hypothetical protein